MRKKRRLPKRLPKHLAWMKMSSREFIADVKRQLEKIGPVAISRSINADLENLCDRAGLKGEEREAYRRILLQPPKSRKEFRRLTDAKLGRKKGPIVKKAKISRNWREEARVFQVRMGSRVPESLEEFQRLKHGGIHAYKKKLGVRLSSAGKNRKK